MTNETPERPLDHATARIVTELAAAFLPHLTETVSAELSKAIKVLPINVDREVEEVLSSFRRLQSLSEDMAAAINLAQNSALRVSDGLLPLSGTSEALNAVTSRLEQITAKPDIVDAVQLNELLRSLEAAIPDWGGILKANGRAQTKELSEFSAEISDLVSGVKSSLLQMMGEILEKKLLASTESWSRTSGENVRALEAKLVRLEKILMAEGVVFILFFAAIAAALLLK